MKQKTIKLDIIERLTSAIVGFRQDRRMLNRQPQGWDFSDFPRLYDDLFGEAVEQVGANRVHDILRIPPVGKMDEMLVYLYSEMELERKDDASGAEYNGPTTDAIESAINEYQFSDEYQKKVEEYRQWESREPYDWDSLPF
jgi:hypothetical protein